MHSIPFYRRIRRDINTPVKTPHKFKGFLFHKSVLLKMILDSDTLRQVFDALDNDKRGYITVEQFTSALDKFYTSLAHESPDDEHHAKLARMQSMDVNNIVNALDPEKDGIISFEDFESAFQDFFNCQSISCLLTFHPSVDREELKGKTMTVNLHGRRVSITPDDYVMQQAEIDQDLKTEDSGFLESGVSEFTPPRPSTLLLSDFRRPSFRRGTPKNASARTSVPSYHENTGSPFSGSRSDLMLDDVDSNLEQLKNQMRQMEAKMDSMTSQAVVASNADGLVGRLREENARLSASVVVLEERIKEIEARHQRDLESERSHLDSLMVRVYHLSLSLSLSFSLSLSLHLLVLLPRDLSTHAEVVGGCYLIRAVLVIESLVNCFGGNNLKFTV
ncbi:hypothetical protein TSMEX_008096 [Taenia solium]|eukprot:TsM_000492000 transcript=TsM_000492000 gene=TsM_000492000